MNLFGGCLILCCRCFCVSWCHCLTAAEHILIIASLMIRGRLIAMSESGGGIKRR